MCFFQCNTCTSFYQCNTFICAFFNATLIYSCINLILLYIWLYQYNTFICFYQCNTFIYAFIKCFQCLFFQIKTGQLLHIFLLEQNSSKTKTKASGFTCQSINQSIHSRNTNTETSQSWSINGQSDLRIRTNCWMM